MSPDPELHTTAADDTGTTRPGHDLRAARERAGVSLESMAERLRLSVPQLEALELDDYAELPPPAFVRGYLRAYARDLGLEPEGFVAAYDATGFSDHDPELRLTTNTEAESGGRGALIGVLLIVLVVGGGIGAWWYQQRMTAPADAMDATTQSGEASESDTADDDAGGSASGTGGESGQGEGDSESDATGTSGDSGEPESSAAGASEPAGGDTASEGDAGTDDERAGANGGDEQAGSPQPSPSVAEGESTTTSPPEPGSGETADDAAETEAAASGAGQDGAEEVAGTGAGANGGADAGETTDAEAPSTEASEPAASSPDATDSATRAATAAATTGPDRILLEFDGRSWLEVQDSRERELAYTLYYGSEPVELRGWAPFEVFLGNSPAVTVRFNGETIDKSSFTRSDNTARFVVDASGVRAR